MQDFTFVVPDLAKHVKSVMSELQESSQKCFVLRIAGSSIFLVKILLNPKPSDTPFTQGDQGCCESVDHSNEQIWKLRVKLLLVSDGVLVYRQFEPPSGHRPQAAQIGTGPCYAREWDTGKTFNPPMTEPSNASRSDFHRPGHEDRRAEAPRQERSDQGGWDEQPSKYDSSRSNFGNRHEGGQGSSVQNQGDKFGKAEWVGKPSQGGWDEPPARLDSERSKGNFGRDTGSHFERSSNPSQSAWGGRSHQESPSANQIIDSQERSLEGPHRRASGSQRGGYGGEHWDRRDAQPKPRPKEGLGTSSSQTTDFGPRKAPSLKPANTPYEGWGEDPDKKDPEGGWGNLPSGSQSNTRESNTPRYANQDTPRYPDQNKNEFGGGHQKEFSSSQAQKDETPEQQESSGGWGSVPRTKPADDAWAYTTSTNSQEPGDAILLTIIWST